MAMLALRAGGLRSLSAVSLIIAGVLVDSSALLYRIVHIAATIEVNNRLASVSRFSSSIGSDEKGCGLWY